MNRYFIRFEWGSYHVVEYDPINGRQMTLSVVYNYDEALRYLQGYLNRPIILTVE